MNHKQILLVKGEGSIDIEPYIIVLMGELVPSCLCPNFSWFIKDVTNWSEPTLSFIRSRTIGYMVFINRNNQRSIFICVEGSTPRESGLRRREGWR